MKYNRVIILRKEKNQISFSFTTKYWRKLRKIFRSKFPRINTFNHERPTMVNAMCDLTVRLFDHMDIMVKIVLDIRIDYTEYILTVPEMEKYRTTLMVFKETARVYVGEQ